MGRTFTLKCQVCDRKFTASVREADCMCGGEGVTFDTDRTQALVFRLAILIPHLVAVAVFFTDSNLSFPARKDCCSWCLDPADGTAGPFESGRYFKACSYHVSHPPDRTSVPPRNSEVDWILWFGVTYVAALAFTLLLGERAPFCTLAGCPMGIGWCIYLWGDQSFRFSTVVVLTGILFFATGWLDGIPLRYRGVRS